MFLLIFRRLSGLVLTLLAVSVLIFLVMDVLPVLVEETSTAAPPGAAAPAGCVR